MGGLRRRRQDRLLPPRRRRDAAVHRLDRRGFGATSGPRPVDAGYVDGPVGRRRRRPPRRLLPRVGGAVEPRISCSRSTGRASHRPRRRAARLGRRQRYGARRRHRRRQAPTTAGCTGAAGATRPLRTGAPSARASASDRRSTQRGAPGARGCDFDADGKADFCRVYTPAERRRLLAVDRQRLRADGRPPSPLDVGYEPGRTWADIDGDERADYCRRVGDGAATRACSARSRPDRVRRELHVASRSSGARTRA